MGYKNSEWNDKNELMCLLILKIIINNNFQKGMQMKLSKEMENNTKLTAKNISAKVGNYKSVAKINKNSNFSQNTKRIYDNYKNTTIPNLEKIINEM